MIYGTYSAVSFPGQGITELEKLLSLMNSNDNLLHRFSRHEFSGGIAGIIQDEYNDCFFLDKKSGNFLLISGQVYNKDELVDYVKSDSEPVSVPELLYRLYQKSGPEFANKLNGDFVIVLALAKDKKLLLFRDHMGIRPLAYTLIGQKIVFSSDILSLCRAFHPDNAAINKERLQKDFKMVDYRQTYNAHVHKLLPGHYLVYSGGKVETNKYWFPEAIVTDKAIKKEEMLATLNDLLRNAVVKRCDLNHQTASHLSGGLDSGIVAAHARKACKDQNIFYGYSWSPDRADFADIEVDERQLARDQARMNKIEMVFINTTVEDYLFFNHNRINNSVFTDENLVLRDARQKGIKIMLSGHGGDEFISKGSRGIDTDLLMRMQWSLFFRINPISKPKSLIRRLLYEIIFPFIGLLSLPVKRDSKLQTQYLKKEFRKENRGNIRRFFFYRSRRELHLGFLYCYYLPDRMEEWYVNGFRHGIEYRYPLLDKDIVEYILKTPSRLMADKTWSRPILREISEGILPESVRWKNTGADPVSFRAARQIIIACSKQYFKEIGQISANPDLDFVDFNKIKKDLNEYLANPDDKKYEYLLYKIYNLKGLHEFTKAYRQ